MKKILIIDEAIVIRQFMKRSIEASICDIKVIVAANIEIGLKEINLHEFDLILLDYKMTEPSGRNCLNDIFNLTHTAVIILINNTTEYIREAIDGLHMGAFDFICKPYENNFDGFEAILVKKVSDALISDNSKSFGSLNTVKENNINGYQKSKQLDFRIEKQEINHVHNNIDVIGIGISTGGPPIITKILSSLPKNFKTPILIVQHMPVGFTSEFAKRLKEESNLNVKEAQNDEKVIPETVYVAKGGIHLEVKKEDEDILIKLVDSDKVSGHKPSVDVLFSSIAKYYGARSLGVIMTGMGSDGSKGLLEMKKKGAFTIGQKEKSCTVYGMPKAAYEIGALDEQLDINEIINTILKIG